MGNLRSGPRHRLVELVAWQMVRRFGKRVPFEELYDLGIPGLVEAQRDWDGRGQFEPFAMERIRWKTIDGLRKRSRDARFMAASAAELSADHHPHTANQLCAAGGNVQQAAEDSIDEFLDAGGASLAADIEGQEDHVQKGEMRRAISNLPPPQDQVIARYVYLGETFDEVGAALGMTASAACKHYAKGVLALQRALGDRGPPLRSPPAAA